MAEPTISVLLLRHVANCVELTGRASEPLLEEFGLGKDLLEDREATLPLRTFLAFFESAAEFANNRHFGLHAGRIASADSLGPLSFLFLSAPTLGEAFSAFVHYLGVMQQSARNSISVGPDTATFEYGVRDTSLGARRQDAEYSIAVTYTLARNYCGGRLDLREVCFEHAQVGDYLTYRDFFDCDVFFDRPRNSISFDAADLTRRGRELSGDLFPILVDHLQSKAEDEAGPATLVERLEDWLQMRAVSAPPKVEDAAAALGLSVHALQRRLAKDGQTFRDMAQHHRMQQACHLLAESDRSIADIALSVGYSESASFIRAFKAQCGNTPERYRRMTAES
ncbi:AraC family transcriptional regulator [Aurantiacibacter rhizosphaerae]|uniref:Helix-turn-helix domain-containing protein n=1 Tax=Aurantiacibacter rhizosphaerae TaxID=2691582 RepID=A0A844XAN4_9SPHN|nr:AraC family transcriptional regulator [Aurantiacibacter rhizosphaerae]MWV27541.1 helix-turn-helix domain-containing protein [Aurantiacibacter rhizosphaerae]